MPHWGSSLTQYPVVHSCPARSCLQSSVPRPVPSPLCSHRGLQDSQAMPLLPRKHKGSLAPTAVPNRPLSSSTAPISQESTLRHSTANQPARAAAELSTPPAPPECEPTSLPPAPPRPFLLVNRFLSNCCLHSTTWAFQPYSLKKPCEFIVPWQKHRLHKGVISTRLCGFEFLCLSHTFPLLITFLVGTIEVCLATTHNISDGAWTWMI